MTMTKKEAIKKYINDLNDDDIILLVSHIDLYDEVPSEWLVHSMDEFDEAMDVYTPTEIAQMVWQADFDPNQNYWKFDGWGKIISLNESEVTAELEGYKDDIADFLTSIYSGDTPWHDLDIVVGAEDDAMFTENYEQIYE